jgi:hypothetical protein
LSGGYFDIVVSTIDNLHNADYFCLLTIAHSPLTPSFFIHKRNHHRSIIIPRHYKRLFPVDADLSDMPGFTFYL